MRLQGARILVNVNAIVTPAAFCGTLLPLRAIENQAYVVAANRAGPAEATLELLRSQPGGGLQGQILGGR